MLNGEGSEDITPWKSREILQTIVRRGHVHSNVCKIRRLAELALVLHKSRSNLACLLILSCWQIFANLSLSKVEKNRETVWLLV